MSLNIRKNEVDYMHLVAFIILFIIGSINAACHKDFSGIEAIGKFLLFVALFFIMAFILMNPALLILAVVIVVIALICCSK